jgi:SET domain-containing protein
MNIEIREAECKGRGVFAKRDIRAGEILEDAPVIVLPADQREMVLRTHLYEYVFQWGKDRVAVCLGWGSIYNHSRNPNACYVRHFEERYIRFEALRDIHQGEEILTNYNGNPCGSKPLWFEESAPLDSNK